MNGLMSRIFFGLAVFGLSAVSLSANVNNGQFATPTNPFTTVTGTAIPGWTVGAGGNVDWIGNYWQSTPGINYGLNPGYSIDLDGSSSVSSISQVIGTTMGDSYTLSFVLSGNPDGPPTVKTLDVIIGGVPTTFTFDKTSITRSDMGWTPESISFTATGSLTEITFESGDGPTPGSYGPVIGDVFVTPEPGFYGALALGMSGLLFAIQRRRRA